MSTTRAGFGIDRRGLILAATASVGLVAVGGARGALATAAAPFRAALSLNPGVEGLLDKGLVYRDGRRTARTLRELQALFVAHGSREVYARMGTSRLLPIGGRNSGIASTLARARLSRELGLAFNPELLLCGVYGDVAGQPAPDFSAYPQIRLRKPWHEVGIEEMADAMRIYGAIAAREILDTGAKVSKWDIGNEVEFGIAGVAIHVPGNRFGPYLAPDAVDPEIGKMTQPRFFGMQQADQLSWASTHLWPHVARIMTAVAEGIRQVDPVARFATHTSTIAGFLPGLLVGFYKAMDAGGFHTEELGTSWYPTSAPLTNRIATFRRIAEAARAQLGRPLFVAEYGYPALPVNYAGQNWANAVPGYPVSPQGQADFLRDLAHWGASTGLLSGIRPWGPDLARADWNGMALFNRESDTLALARPALSAIQEGVRAAAIQRPIPAEWRAA